VGWRELEQRGEWEREACNTVRSLEYWAVGNNTRSMGSEQDMHVAELALRLIGEDYKALLRWTASHALEPVWLGCHDIFLTRSFLFGVCKDGGFFYLHYFVMPFCKCCLHSFTPDGQ
jgi:hypothetical protein